MEQYIKLMTPVSEGLPEINEIGLSEWVPVIEYGRYSNYARLTEQGQWEDKRGAKVKVTHYMDYSKLTTIEAAKEAIESTWLNACEWQSKEKSGYDENPEMGKREFINEISKKL